MGGGCRSRSRERNRVHARRSRLRRKHQLSSLQATVSELTQVRASLRRELAEEHGVAFQTLPSQELLLKQEVELRDSIAAKADAIRDSYKSVQPRDRRRRPSSAFERLERMYVVVYHVCGHVHAVGCLVARFGVPRGSPLTYVCVTVVSATASTHAKLASAAVFAQRPCGKAWRFSKSK